MKIKKPAAAATNWAHWETEMHSKYCSNKYEANMQMCKRDGKPRKRSKKSKMQTKTKIEGRESVYSVCKNGRECIGWEWREWQERESDTILTNRQIYALGLIWMGGERGSTHTALQIQIQMHACVRLFIGICPKDTTYTKLHQHIAVSNILLSIHSTYYLFCLGTQTPIILVVRQCFFLYFEKNRLFEYIFDSTFVIQRVFARIRWVLCVFHAFFVGWCQMISFIALFYSKYSKTFDRWIDSVWCEMCNQYVQSVDLYCWEMRRWWRGAKLQTH